MNYDVIMYTKYSPNHDYLIFHSGTIVVSKFLVKLTQNLKTKKILKNDKIKKKQLYSITIMQGR